MSHPYPIRVIASQSGLSEATVDRVLNRRGGVRQSTMDEVHRAIAELSRQRSQLRLAGRTFVVDLVVDAPDRFSSAVRAALEATLPLIRPATFRARFHFGQAPPTQLAATLDGIAQRGSQGVVLKAPDDPLVVAAVERLASAGIPVVTLVTDLPTSRRIAYVGVDNRAAGAVAAYLLDQWLPADGAVLITRGDGSFRGEEDRETGFRVTTRSVRPSRRQVDLGEPAADDEALHVLVTDALAADPGIIAVYSMYAFGGGNAATVAAFTAAGRGCQAFVAHDLDAQNLALLQAGHLSVVLHHDLALDLRRACQVIMQEHQALPGTPHSWHSGVQVVTPYNIPAEALSPPGKT